MAGVKRFVLEEILTEKQIHHVLKRSIGENVPCDLKYSEVRPAVDGIAGFLGDHLKAVLYVDVQGEERKVHLFLKRLPLENKSKTNFINEGHFYLREQLMYQLLENLCEDGTNPWCVKAYIYTDSVFVMPDLSLEGYSSSHYLNTLDLEHILLATSSIARFHAAFFNYETKKSISLKRSYNLLQEYGHILYEPQFCDSPFLRACSKVSAKFLENFSSKSFYTIPDLESKLKELYIKACDSVTEYKDTVNVILHKDLWANNIMFKYENGVPINAILVDFQAARYAPPAFDIMLFLYLTTDKRFRQEREKDICHYYYSTFLKNLSKDSMLRVNDLGYDKDDFLKWCEKGRMFGMFLAIALYPFALMDPKTAQKVFDDPETSQKHMVEDRSEPAMAHATICESYKRRNLEVTEVFVETYMLKQP